MRTFRWLLYNGGFAASIYFGVYGGNDGFSNITIVFAWLTIVSSFFLLSDKFVADIAKKGKAPSVPRSVDILFDVSVIVSLVYAGWIVTGIGYLIHLIFLQGSYDRLFNLDDGDMEESHY